MWVNLPAILDDPSALNTGIDFGNFVVFRLCFLTKSSLMHDPVHPESIKAFIEWWLRVSMVITTPDTSI